MLERGRDELLLTNTREHRPLYIKHGRSYIKTFLETVGELASYDSIAKAYPQERSLLDLLLEYRIVLPRRIAGQGAQRGDSSKGAPPGKKTSLSLYLLLSQSCNMKCIYCMYGAGAYHTGMGLKMTREIALKSIDRCFEDIGEGGRLEVIFFGGEPLLNWPLAKEVILHCERRLKEEHRGKTRRYHVASNLTVFPADLIEWATKHDISFLCDIDGPPEIHNLSRPFRDGRGTYEATAGSIRRLRAAGLNVHLRATVTALNQDYLLEIAEHHKAVGGQSSAFCPVFAVNTDGNILPRQLLPSPEKVMQGMTRVFRSKLWEEWQLYPFNMYAPRFGSGSSTVLGCGAPCGTVPDRCRQWGCVSLLISGGTREASSGQCHGFDLSQEGCAATDG